MIKIILDIPWIGPSTNKMYSGMHIQVRKRLKDVGHLATKIAVRNQLGNPAKLQIPVHLTFTPHHNGRLFDLDGYVFTAKIITDGLVKDGPLKDDSQKYVRGLTILPTVKSKERFMRVEIERAWPD